jgi:hypothetical protein
MNNMLDYIEKYGDFSFKEKAFNEVDNLIFSQLAYTDFKDIADKQSVSLLKGAKLFFAMYTQEEIENLIAISVKSADLLKKCSMTKRFSNVIMCDYINNVNDDIDKQFSAIHFLLDDGSDVVAFRGTDVTVTGVKESAMLSYMFPVPAQIEALYYFQETSMLHSGDIILCGHSKGGNLAVFAAVNCSNSLKKRIKAVYEDDAPGFPKYFFDRYDYCQIKDKIHLITPQTSIIGRMLYHDAAPLIVHSENAGLKQHQASSWQVEGDRFKTEEKYDRTSDFISDYINELIDYISDEELELFFDTLEYVAENMGIVDFYDTKEIDIKKALGLIDSVTTLDDEQKSKFKQILKKVIADFTKEYLSQKTQVYKSVLENLPFKKRESIEGEEIITDAVDKN